MIKNSVGNIVEILDLLDKNKYLPEQIQENYQMLIQKWGEWELVGENSAGFVVRYVDVRNALFSGLMITYMVLTIIFFVLSFVIGKILFPQLAKIYTNNNDEMVDLATLKSAQKINELTEQKPARKEWF